MFIYKTKYNKDLYHVKLSSKHGCNVSVELKCVSHSCVFDVNGKKYIDISLENSKFTEQIQILQTVMNKYFEKKESLSPNIRVKVPFRYGKFEIKRILDDLGYLITTEEIRPNMMLKIVLEISSVFDYGVNWIIRDITVLKEL